MSKNVDVLAVMQRSIDMVARPHEDGFHEARDAVAELIQVASDFNDYLAVDNDDTSLLDRDDMWDRLNAALTRVKGD